MEKTLYDIGLKIKQIKNSTVYMVMVENKLDMLVNMMKENQDMKISIAKLQQEKDHL